MKTSPQKGFTLIELMIVVAIIGILAAIAIPKFAQMLEKSREGATKGNMGALHSAIAIYQGDSLGQIPNNLLDWFSTGGSIAYIDNIPPVRATGKNTKNTLASYNSPAGNGVVQTALSTGSPSIFVASTSSTGWIYDDGGDTYSNNAKGYIYINSTILDSMGASYTTYGY